MDRTNELRSRIEAKQKQLEADLARAKADAHGKMNDTVALLEGKLKSLAGDLQSGWDKLSQGAVERLNDWLKT